MTDVKQYKRKCENWLIDFGKWTLPRSEAPETFIFWTGLFTLAAALRRRVFIPKSTLGSWSCAPNLYILFIAPAGRARKSTTANYTEELLDTIPGITKSPELVTKESLLNQLVKSNDAAMYIVAPEFGEFIVKSGPTMFGFLTNMYDGKKNISSATLTRGGEFAEKPCVNLLGATTPEWVAENMPESVIGGGFASRVIFIFEDKVRRREIFYADEDLAKVGTSHENLETLHKNLMDDLLHISENISGEFQFTPGAKEFFDDWYKKHADGERDDHKLSGYYERRPAHVMKIAMLLHLAREDSLVLTVEDLEQAITIVKQPEKKLPNVFQSIGKNPYTVDIYRILDYILEKGAVTKESVRRHFMHSATPSVLNELMDGLAAAGYVTVRVDGDVAYLVPKPQLRIERAVE